MLSRLWIPPPPGREGNRHPLGNRVKQTNFIFFDNICLISLHEGELNPSRNSRKRWFVILFKIRVTGSEGRETNFIKDQGGKFTGNLGTRFPQNVYAQANFLLGFTHCSELISLTAGCELTRNDFLCQELISCDKI